MAPSNHPRDGESLPSSEDSTFHTEGNQVSKKGDAPESLSTHPCKGLPDEGFGRRKTNHGCENSVDDSNTNSTDLQFKFQFDAFNETFKGLLRKESSAARSLFPFIRGRLIQYGLSRNYDEVVILQEVYYRTIEKILEGRIITNYEAWIRSVAHRYIQELSRKHRQHQTFDEIDLETIPSSADASVIDAQFLSDEEQKVQLALQQLSEEDRMLLERKITQSWSWNEIYQEWIARDYPPISMPALRKRKERALAALRRAYHDL